MSRKVAVLVGSLRKGAFTRAIAEAARELAAPKLDLAILEIGDLPFYNPDLETDSPPAAWQRLRDQVSGADAVLFVTPEYNRSYPAVLKNALDIGSRPYGKSVWAGKPAAIISASPGMLGGFGANHHLRQPLVCLDMPVLQQPEAYLSKVGELFDGDGKLTSDSTRTFLQTFLGRFADWIERAERKR